MLENTGKKLWSGNQKSSRPNFFATFHVPFLRSWPNPPAVLRLASTFSNPGINCSPWDDLEVVFRPKYPDSTPQTPHLTSPPLTPLWAHHCNTIRLSLRKHNVKMSEYCDLKIWYIRGYWVWWKYLKIYIVLLFYLVEDVLMSHSFFIALPILSKVPCCHPTSLLSLLSLFSHVIDSQPVICQYCGSSGGESSYTDTNIDLAPRWAALSRAGPRGTWKVLNNITYTVTEICKTVGL